MTLDESLAELTAAYAVARTLTAEAAGESQPGTCRYCGKRWDKMLGSRLDGHAACVVTPEFRQLVIAFQREHYAVTNRALATALGVTTMVLKSWTHSRTTGWLGGATR